MSSMEQRVLAALGNDEQRSPWEQLISLFQADKEAFYLLACDGVPPQAPAGLRELADLAGQVRDAVRESYEIETVDGRTFLVGFSGKKTPIPANLVQRVAHFLRDVDGKATATHEGKDYEGEEVSEAEVRFKLGDRSTWAAERAKLEEERRAVPMVLRLSSDDLGHLPTQPPYVIYELLHCARRTVLAPTSVFKGLKRGDGGLLKLNNGWAFCGKPRLAYRNDGTSFSAPEGMVYVVYADEDRYVFDWDWVRENPDEPGYPLDWQLRFDTPVSLGQDVVLDLPKGLEAGKFDATKACYSSRGDCIFCYMTDEESYAERNNSDLTVFRQLVSNMFTGFKVKNVRRILQQDKSIVIADAPGLTVSVDSALLATLKFHKDAQTEIYAVLIRALLKGLEEPPRVQVPPQPPELVAA